MLVYLNNKLVPSSEAKISVFDHGFLYGDGIYETLRVYDGVVFKFDEHLQRLYRSASLIRLNIAKNFSEIKIATYETLHVNKLSDAYVRITISRGVGQIGIDPDLCKEPTFVIIANEFKRYPKSFYEKGIKLIVANTKRNLKDALDPQIKSLNFLNNILAKIEAKQADAYEAIMLNESGYVTEGTISNIFFVLNGVLCTPSVESGILDGITRSLAIELAIKNGFEVKEGFFTPKDLYDASEVFITNTTLEIMPVSKINDIKYKIGDVSRILLKKYREEVSAYVKEKKIESPSIWE
jgi:branched-chain amino acid aminotransferase